MSLPRSLDELHGLRAARWVRESTAGQYDAFGPESQCEQQDRAIERYGLLDTGLAWQVAHSGRTVGSTAQFAEMMAAAGRDYDVLVVGYVSRFARDLRTAVNARHDLHRAGASILFADERILTSDDDAWDSWAREAVEAESYSRKLARRIREGYAAKRRRLGEPGGRPPFGWRRAGRPPQLVPDERLGVSRAAYELAAAGHSDREVARRVGLPIDTIRGILTNPIYAGQLRDGSPASVEPVVDRETWDRVQALRRARNARAGRPAIRRVYALPMLRCAFCGRRLIGDSGRYRHLDPCAEFMAARRKTAYRNRLVRTAGKSQPAELYERCIQPALDAVRLETATLTEAASHYATLSPAPDEVGLRRIAQQRERALSRYASDRNVAALEASMSRLDEEEQAIRDRTDELPDWSKVLHLLRSMPELWRKATDEDRRSLAEQLFDSIDARGARSLTVNFRHGVQAVVMVGARGIEPTVTSLRTPWSVEASDAG